MPHNEIHRSFQAFGSNSTSSKVDDWINSWLNNLDDFLFMLVLAGSKTAEVEGISAAGATSESRQYTALADAELLLNGPSIHMNWPLPPLSGGVSPALISYVSSSFLNVKPLVVAIGLSQSPTFPHLAIESPLLGPAECLTSGKAMNMDRVETLWQRGFKMGQKLTKPLLLAECVPGGTTTAHAVLTGLGLKINNLISGSARNPPVDLKKALVQKGLSAAKLGVNPLAKKLIASVGDPFQPFSVGLVLGAREAKQPVLLGGGSQMLAVLALALSVIQPQLRAGFVEEIAIGTTSWLAGETINASQGQKSFIRLIDVFEEFFEIRLLGLASGLNFQETNYKVLRDYEFGYIKEGVGAGALSLLAQLAGVSRRNLVKGCELAVDQM